MKAAILPKLDALAFFDYEQIEYRLLAYYLAEQLGETRMVENFRAGIDPHTATAHIILDAIGRSYADPLDDADRQIGKVGNFSIVYSGGKPTIIRQLRRAGVACDEALAGRILEAIRSNMPEVKDLNNEIKEIIFHEGYIKTLWGRHLTLDPTIPRHDAVRKMLNALIQGCAADLMRHAMRQVARGLFESDCRSHLVLTVHDELGIDAARGELGFLSDSVPVWMDYEEISEVVPVLTDMTVSFDTWATKEKYVRG